MRPAVGQARRWSDESGAVGGFEALPLGVLVFVVGTLLVANAWGILDARIAASAAAREAGRAFVESTAGSVEGAVADAQEAAGEAIRGHGRDPARMAVTTEGPLRFERCAPVTFVVAYPVPSIVLPWIEGFGPGPVTVRSRHREVVDPFRDDVPAGPGAGMAC